MHPIVPLFGIATVLIWLFKADTIGTGDVHTEKPVTPKAEGKIPDGKKLSKPAGRPKGSKNAKPKLKEKENAAKISGKNSAGDLQPDDNAGGEREQSEGIQDAA